MCQPLVQFRIDFKNRPVLKEPNTGIITPCDAPTEWCSPAFFVPKGDGKRVRLVTDYTTKDIFDLASPRLQRLREKVTMYCFNVRWVPGKTHYIADALSCAPLFAPEELPDLEIDTAVSCLANTSHPSLNIVYAAVDEDYNQLIRDVQNNTCLSSYSSACLLYTSPSPRDRQKSRMPSSA